MCVLLLRVLFLVPVQLVVCSVCLCVLLCAGIIFNTRAVSCVCAIVVGLLLPTRVAGGGARFGDGVEAAPPLWRFACRRSQCRITARCSPWIARFALALPLLYSFAPLSLLFFPFRAYLCAGIIFNTRAVSCVCAIVMGLLLPTRVAGGDARFGDGVEVAPPLWRFACRRSQCRMTARCSPWIALCSCATLSLLFCSPFSTLLPLSRLPLCVLLLWVLFLIPAQRWGTCVRETGRRWALCLIYGTL